MLFRSDPTKKTGAEVNIPVKTREDFSLFSETPSRIIISVSPANKAAFEELASKSKTPYKEIGKTGGSKLSINGKYSFELDKLADLYYNTISRIMEH